MRNIIRSLEVIFKWVINIDGKQLVWSVFKFHLRNYVTRLSAISGSHFLFLLLTGLDLQSGVQYTFIVAAVNVAGLKVQTLSDGFTVDFTPPTISKAWVGDDTRNILYHSDPTKITVRYNTLFVKKSLTA